MSRSYLGFVLLALLIIPSSSAHLWNNVTKDIEKEMEKGVTNVEQLVSKLLPHTLGINWIKIIEDLLRLYMRELHNKNATLCANAMLDVVDRVKLFKMDDLSSQAAVRMIDSMGKPASGVLNGAILWLGSYDECLAAGSADRPVNYCVPRIGLANAPNVQMDLAWAFCVPSPQCDADSLQFILNFFIQKATAKIPLLAGKVSVNSTLCAAPAPWDTGTFLTISGVVLFSAIAIFAAATFHLLGKHSIMTSVSRSRGLVQFLHAFDISKNSKWLMRTSKKDGEIESLNGLKAISMGWLLLGWLYVSARAFVANAIDLQGGLGSPGEGQQFLFQIVAAYVFATDTFLVVAGVKLSYSMCRKLLEGTRLKMNGLEWIVYMFGRYLGLAPMLYIWIAIFIYIVPHVVEGPFTVILQQDIGIPMDSCKANWWSNILYINNFYPFTDSDKCLDWTDYIGVEAQLFFLSPIVIYLIFRYRKIGSMLAWLLVFLPMGFRFYIALNLGLPVTPFGQKFIPTSGNNNLTDFDDAGLADYINFYPYTRCDSIIIGILVGCMLALRKTNANSGGFRMNRAIALLVGLILAAGVSTCIFGLTNQWYPDSMSADWRAAWHTVSRTLWALYVAWIIICDEGKAAGPVGAILGLKIWKPLQRLVYSSFLIYPGIAQFYLANQRNPIYFDDLNILCIFLLILAATVLVAAGFTLIFEVPFRRFEQSFRLAFLGKRYLTRDFDETDTGIAKSGDDTEDLIDSAEQQPNA